VPDLSVSVQEQFRAEWKFSVEMDAMKISDFGWSLLTIVDPPLASLRPETFGGGWPNDTLKLDVID
jgi:hypothetical protein